MEILSILSRFNDLNSELGTRIYSGAIIPEKCILGQTRKRESKIIYNNKIDSCFRRNDRLANGKLFSSTSIKRTEMIERVTIEIVIPFRFVQVPISADRLRLRIKASTACDTALRQRTGGGSP